MSNRSLAPELEARIVELEQEKNQGGGLSGGDWLFLALSGVVFPVALLIWGWI